MQKIFHNYRDPRSALGINDHFKTVVPAGLHSGGKVTASATPGVLSIQPFVLFTNEGVRIEETEEVADFNSASPLSVNASSLTRADIVLVEYAFAQTVPPPEATYTVLEDDPFPVLTAGQYPIAILLVPPGTNIPSAVLRFGRRAENQNRIVLGDGKLANGLGGIGSRDFNEVVRALNASGGGIVELAGDEFTPFVASGLVVPSGVIVDGGPLRQIRQRGEVPIIDFMFKLVGADSTGAVSGGNVLTDAGVLFKLHGLGSLVVFDGGPNAGKRAYIQAIPSDHVAVLATEDYKPLTLTNDASANYRVFISRAGIRNVYIHGDELGVSGAAVEMAYTDNCDVRDAIFDKLTPGSPIAAAIRATGDNYGLDIRRNFVRQGYTKGMDIGTGGGENERLAVIDNTVNGAVSVATSGAGDIAYDGNRVTGTETLPATAGWRGRSALAVHNENGTLRDGIIAFVKLASDVLTSFVRTAGSVVQTITGLKAFTDRVRLSASGAFELAGDGAGTAPLVTRATLGNYYIECFNGWADSFNDTGSGKLTAYPAEKQGVFRDTQGVVVHCYINIPGGQMLVETLIADAGWADGADIPLRRMLRVGGKIGAPTSSLLQKDVAGTLKDVATEEHVTSSLNTRLLSRSFVEIASGTVTVSNNGITSIPLGTYNESNYYLISAYPGAANPGSTVVIAGASHDSNSNAFQELIYASIFRDSGGDRLIIKNHENASRVVVYSVISFE